MLKTSTGGWVTVVTAMAAVLVVVLVGVLIGSSIVASIKDLMMQKQQLINGLF
jgi:hypothetical protein